MDEREWERELAAIDPQHLEQQIEAQKAAQIAVMHDYVYRETLLTLGVPRWLAALLTLIRASRY